jgi:diguanylate cyclase (GGDEF)-like protein
MDRILARLIGLVIETAGAQSGFLLLEQNDEWRVVAEQRPDRSNVEVLQWRPLDDYPDIAAAVVHYVARTNKVVNLDDATKSTVFAADPSIASRHCKSLLCMPIVNRGELAGILYLENNLAAHAFTRTHTRILQLLTTQAISSLEISSYFARVQTLNLSLEEEIDERKRTESQLEFLANHDPLTNLPNRRLFYDRVRHAIQRVQRSGGRVVVLFLDIDRFKNINDTLSHQVGDRLLQQVAKRLASQVRQEDTLARLGGDEYILLMEGDVDLRDLSRVAEKLLDTFRDPFRVDDHDLYATGSIGLSLYPDDAENTDQLMRNSDAAMYQAKQAGRNTYRFFSPQLAEAAAERLALEHDLRRAIEREEFELYFQPQVELKSNRVIGAEVLLRWNHPVRGLLLPDSFIPVAEENGGIIAIGEWVLRQSCRQLEQWRRKGLTIDRLAVNVSSKQFGSHSRFVDMVKQVFDASDIDPSTLELELTESVILQDTDSFLDALEQLNALGVRLAIDDFGTGYSSLSYLHRLPMQRLKIDRSFVSNLPDTQDSAVIVQSIMLLSQKLGKQVIAEGVETEAQRRFLLQSNCKEGQGYLFGAPMPLECFEKRLRDNGA